MPKWKNQLNRISNSVYRTLRPRRVRYYNDDGTPKTIVRTKGSGFGGLGNSKHSTRLLQTYWTYYQKESTVWAAVNSIAYNTVMVGYTIKSDDPEAQKLIQDWARKVDLDSKMLDNTIYALVMGDSYLEKVHNKKGEITRLKDVDPKTMNIQCNDYGEVEGYQQEIRGEETPMLKPEEICQINFFPQPSQPYGISLLAASKGTIDKKVRTDDAIANAIIRHGTTKTVFTVGSEKEKVIPDDEVLKAIENSVEDLNEKNDIIVPWNVKVQTLDEKGISGVEEYYSYFQTQVVLGLLCPEEALGLGAGSTEATARVKAILYERMIKSFQMRLSKIIEKQLFDEVLEQAGKEPGTVRISFNSVTEEDEAMKAKWMGNMIRGFQHTKVKPFTINEVREKFGLDPIDDPMANSLNWGLDDDESIENEEKEDGEDEEGTES